MDNNTNLNDFVSLEQSCFENGYSEGFDRGKVEGQIEGGELGRSSGFDTWEELGYYKGQALLWKHVLSSLALSSAADATEKETSLTSKTQRSLSNIEQLLSLIDRFPSKNDSSLLTQTQQDSSADTDLSTLLSSIRSKYRMTCSNLGARPRLQQASESV